MGSILITGGAGFIGSHTCVVLLNAGYNLIIIDNFSNSSPSVISSIAKLAKLEDKITEARLQLVKGDIRDKELVTQIFEIAKRKGTRIIAVIHFAGLKSVHESIQKPLLYWDVNTSGTRKLLEVMNEFSCKVLVFSSSATVYGDPCVIPIDETSPINPINPYGKTKAAVEMLLADISNCQQRTKPFQKSPTDWRIAILRYFNPVGAHPSGEIGEDPKGIPNNLFPLINQVAEGKRDLLHIFGNDWPTIDGTGVRDYIHVMDLAEGHKAALEKLLRSEPQLLTLNLGSGKGHSVLELIHCFEEVTGKKISYQIANRRAGDSAISIASPKLALKYLNWSTQKSLKDICDDGWNWQSKNIYKNKF
ncbi:UDP-glucose 4-epimerase GalE [Prochlorococcus sp. MIT 1223]|uniref:UDP-glucose 4-epimerase GalE n=1 Tax=Prochlorococcus sp. MIT 1223 TaxID=3096217 RepID=UPI002A763812|nr:UDP-glucose 4-epimerase GalE [Prochlorococcus sp. MIT 1223]